MEFTTANLFFMLIIKRWQNHLQDNLIMHLNSQRQSDFLHLSSLPRCPGVCYTPLRCVLRSFYSVFGFFFFKFLYSSTLSSYLSFRVPFWYQTSGHVITIQGIGITRKCLTLAGSYLRTSSHSVKSHVLSCHLALVSFTIFTISLSVLVFKYA